MSHFKYEIDERNLRVQLKSNEVAFNEEAWHKFESFSITRKNSADQAVTKRFNFSLNRNVMLPVVFGTVIILFSFLLFNFINIKNPNTAREERAEVQKQAEKQPALAEEKKEIVLPAKETIETPVQPENTLPVASTAFNPADNKEASLPTPAKKEVPVQQLAKSPTVVVPARPETGSANATPNPAYNSSQTMSTRQAKKQRTAIVSEATSDEDEQAPPPVSELPAQEQLN